LAAQPPLQVLDAFLNLVGRAVYHVALGLRHDLQHVLHSFTPSTFRATSPARAPYFHNGFAATLDEVIDFYESRFKIGLSPRERSDLIAFLKAL
jgi:hypothetical protein